MSPSITLSHLAWAFPEGHHLFTDLSLNFEPERTGLIGRNGTGKSTLLRLIHGDLKPASGKISAPVHLAMLRQMTHVAPDETVADLFNVRQGLERLQRIADDAASDDDFDQADWTLEARLLAAMSRTGLEVSPRTLLSTLSGGQRTRAALAALVFTEPDFLLLDEPTNHLDREGRDAVIALLASWRSGAIVVSHDRELLEGMDAIVELTTLGAGRYGGNWSAYREYKEQELAAAQHAVASAEKRATSIARTAQDTAERKARKDAAGKRKGARGGMPPILLGRRKEMAENTSGMQSRLFEQRRVEAEDAATAARERIEKLTPLTVALTTTSLPAGKTVVECQDVTVGHLPGQPILRDFSFSITGPERVAIKGPNGSGKSTLLTLLNGTLKPWSGSIHVRTRFAMLDQQVSLMQPALTIRDNVKRLHPELSENACRAALARFMFRAEAALQPVGTLSGGELLRAGLACVLGGSSPPPLLLLDEPTNHLDIHSIEAVEHGLNSYDGALLVISHDEPFLQNLGVTRTLRLPSLVQ